MLGLDQPRYPALLGRQPCALSFEGPPKLPTPGQRVAAQPRLEIEHEYLRLARRGDGLHGAVGRHRGRFEFAQADQLERQHACDGQREQRRDADHAKARVADAPPSPICRHCEARTLARRGARRRNPRC